jgi:hypothetical protein
MRADVIVDSLDSGASPEEAAAALELAEELETVSADLEVTGDELETAPMAELASEAAEAVDEGVLPGTAAADAAVTVESEDALDAAADGTDRPA